MSTQGVALIFNLLNKNKMLDCLDPQLIEFMAKILAILGL